VLTEKKFSRTRYTVVATADSYNEWSSHIVAALSRRVLLHLPIPALRSSLSNTDYEDTVAAAVVAADDDDDEDNDNGNDNDYCAEQGRLRVLL